MQLSQTEMYLIAGLRMFDLSEEEQEMIFLILRTEEQQSMMMDCLADNRDASGEDIKKEMLRIYSATMYKERASALSFFYFPIHPIQRIPSCRESRDYQTFSASLTAPSRRSSIFLSSKTVSRGVWMRSM